MFCFLSWVPFKSDLLGILIMTFVVPFFLAAGFRAMAKSKVGAAQVCLLAAGLAIPLAYCGFFGLALQSLMTLVFMLACVVLPWRARVPVVARVLSHGLILFLLIAPQYRVDSSLRATCPLESVAGCLNYEPAAAKAVRLQYLLASASLSPTSTELLAMHDAGQADFLDAERNGFVKHRELVAGFQAHHFAKVPPTARSRRSAGRILDVCPAGIGPLAQARIAGRVCLEKPAKNG